MNAVPPSVRPAPGSLRPRLASRPAGMTGTRWAALSDAAAVVAALAALEPERAPHAVRNFPALIRDAESWRRERAEQGVADLVPGLAALLAVNARGADPRPAALALWHEFAAAHAAIVALLPPET